MSATNSTANYELPIFLATDKPAWLTDWNGAMSAIDTAIHSAQSTADGAQTTAGTAIADIATINASLTTITGNITSLTTTVNGNTGAINTINSLIGNGQPTTEDKTLIGAINEIYGMITGGGDPIEAENVSYDNTTSGLTAVDVQSAIDELASAPAPAQEYDFDLSAHTGSVTLASAVGTIDTTESDVSYLLNDDKSIGKIYGGIYLSSVTLAAGWTTIVTMTSSDFAAITNAYNIDMGYTLVRVQSALTCRRCRLHFNTDGSIELQTYSSTGDSDQSDFISLPPCVYFLKDMGD